MIPKSSDFYGDDTRWFIGRVISINDPLEQGRVRIRIYGIHTDNLEDIPERDLPWAQIVVPVTEGGSSGIGANTGIKVNSQVFGVFLDGKHSQLPIILGSIPKIETKINKVTTNYNKLTEIVVLTGSTNIEKAYNYFISREGGGFAPYQAAGIVGNLMQESGTLKSGDINPLALNVSEGSFGVAQWNPARGAGARLEQLKKWSSENGLNYRSLEAQLAFIKYELYSKSYFGLYQLRNAKTAAEASIAFEKYYERPAPGSTDKRIAYAEETYEKMEA
jgi:hypothetical protein